MLRRLLGLRVEHEAAMLVECSEGDGQVEPIVLSAWQPRVFYATVVACTCQGQIFECIVHLQAIFLDDGDDDDILLYLITDIGLQEGTSIFHFPALHPSYLSYYA